MAAFFEFLESPTGCMILWGVVAVCYLVFRSKYKADEQENLEKAEQINQDKLGKFLIERHKKNSQK